MSELEVLVGNVEGLKKLLRIAWRDLANPLLTAFERREARNQINQYSVELRRHLQLQEAERIHSRKNSGSEEGHHFDPRLDHAISCRTPRPDPERGLGTVGRRQLGAAVAVRRPPR
jgi:hypothetical protein